MQLDSRCRPKGHLDATRRPDGVLVLLGPAGHHYPLAGPQRVVDPADRRAPYLLQDLIESVQDRQDQPVGQERLGLSGLSPVCRRRGGQGRVVDDELGSQPAVQILDGRVPRRDRGQDLRASKSRTRRTISIVFPEPGSPSTTSLPVGTRASTSTSFRPLPARK